MKKKLLTIVASLTLIFALLLTGCGVSQDMADKINKKVEDGEYTYSQLLKDYKDPTIDLTATVFDSTSGTVIYVKGCKTAEDVEAKLDEGKELDAVYVVIFNNKVTGATYEKYSPDKK